MVQQWGCIDFMEERITHTRAVRKQNIVDGINIIYKGCKNYFICASPGEISGHWLPSDCMSP
jgi:hypothetical protein